MIIEMRSLRLLLAKQESRNHIIPVLDIMAAATAISISCAHQLWASRTYHKVEKQSHISKLALSLGVTGSKSVVPGPIYNCIRPNQYKSMKKYETKITYFVSKSYARHPRCTQRRRRHLRVPILCLGRILEVMPIGPRSLLHI